MLRFNFGTLADNVLGVIFQYILCYGSTAILEQLKKGNSCISIHPMLRFNMYPHSGSCIKRNFNTSYVTVQLCGIGLRLVIRIKFQYILCYGSTVFAIYASYAYPNFNTSYVTVQRCSAARASSKRGRFQYILCYGSTRSQCSAYSRQNSISIHPMLRFNVELYTNKKDLDAFQYILCYGSTYNQAFMVQAHILFQYILCYGSTLNNANS